MTQQDPQPTATEGIDAIEAVPAPRGPVPDLGFFAGAPTPRESFGAPAPLQLGGPAPSQFGGPAASQFGGPAASQFGGPVGVGPATAPLPVTGRGSWWKPAVAGGVALLLLVVLLGGRFGWQQFMADPVTPETLLGQPRIADASADALLQGAQDQVADELTSGSAVRVALYGDGIGTSYMLFAARGGSRPGDDAGDDDSFSGWTESRHGDVTCFSQPAQGAQAAGFGATMCLRSFWRRAVFVMGMGVTAPDAAVVAQATEEAWDAQ